MNDVAVLVVRTPVDHDEIGLLFENQQGMVPDAPMVIDALEAVGDKGANVLGLRVVAGRGNHHQERPIAQRHEGLAGKGMPLHHSDPDGLRPGPGMEDVEERPAAGFQHIDVREIVVPRGETVVDREGLAPLGLDDVAEGGKGFSRQRRYLEFQPRNRSKPPA